METILLRSLLLACCLSGADVLQTDKNESKDCAVSLAELRVKMEYLQKEHEAQAVKLKELEKQKTQVNVMKRQLRAQATALHSIKATSTITGSQVKALQQDMKVKQVAFSASLVASGTVIIGPYNRLIPLVYKGVITNIGNAYNSHTGVFTAPVKGAYHFQFYVGADSHVTSAVLVKNGKNVFIAYENQKSSYGTSSNGVSLLLNVGDAVAMHLWPGAKIFDNTNHHSTFSGHLLFTT